MRALDYVGLVGKYIRMSCPITDEVELLEHRATMGFQPEEGTPTKGGEGVVAMVRDADCVGGRMVEIMFDYGMGFIVNPDEDWTFTIYDSEEMAAIFVKEIREALERKKAYRERRAAGRDERGCGSIVG
jgi:hypothetical protein